MKNKLTAEFVGTLWLVLGGCGTAILAAPYVGVLGVSIAFGFTVVTMAYAVGHISGCHLNPAITIGLAAAGRHPKSEVLGYVIAQVLGGIAGAGIIYLIASGNAGFDKGTFAANGWGIAFGGPDAPTYSMMSAFICEVVMTCVFVLVILGATSKGAPSGFAGLAIGLCLVLIHLISIPITNTSVNPARSTGPALIAGGVALKQLWLFWVAPVIGGLIAAPIWCAIAGKESNS